MALIRATYFSSALAGQNTFNLVLPNDVPLSWQMRTPTTSVL